MTDTITKDEAIEIAGKEIVELAEKENCECSSNVAENSTNWKASVENNDYRVTARYWVSDDEMKLEADQIDWDEALEGFEVEEIEVAEYSGWEVVIAGMDCDGQAVEYAKYITDNYPEISVELIENQSGGSIVLDSDGEEIMNQSIFWEEYCND